MSGRRYTITGDFWFDETDGLWKPSDFSKASQWHVVIVQELLRPNKSGVSDFMSIEEASARCPNQAAQIGGNGSHAFSRGLLARNFIFNDADAVIRVGKGGRVTHRRSLGLVEKQVMSPAISKSIHNAVSRLNCALTGTRTRVEVDHREGRPSAGNDHRASERVEDFQPLCAVANLIKREACARCKKTDKRFDARRLGYTIGWAKGGAPYRGTCEGCYWHGIREFRSELWLREADGSIAASPGRTNQVEENESRASNDGRAIAGSEPLKSSPPAK